MWPTVQLLLGLILGVVLLDSLRRSRGSWRVIELILIAVSFGLIAWLGMVAR